LGDGLTDEMFKWTTENTRDWIDRYITLMIVRPLAASHSVGGKPLIHNMLATSEAKYAIEQVIRRAPGAVPRMMKEIDKSFPQYRDWAEKMMLLV
jgi:hypothetical protein